MKYEITSESAYLQVDVFDPLVGPEGEYFLRQVAAESRKHCQSRILVVSRSASPMPLYAYYMLITFGQALNLEGDHRIAMIDENNGVTQLNQFAETVTRPEKLNVMAFADVSSALNWLFKDRRLHARRIANEAV